MAQFGSDTFAGTEGTELSTYNAAWTRHPSYSVDSEIASGRARTTAGGNSAYYHSGTPASADYSVTADLYFHETDGGGSNAGVLGRTSTSANTFYMARYEGGSNDSWQLYKCVSGTFTLLGSSPESISAGTSNNLKLEMIGSAIKLYKQGSGTALISVTDTAITAAGKAGIRLVSSQSDTIGIHADNFSADDVAAGVSVNVPTGSISYTGNAPTVAVSNHQNISVPAGSLSINGLAPTVTAGGNQVVNVPVGSITLSGQVPTVTASDHQDVTVPAGAVSYTGLTPTVSATANQTVNVPVGSVSYSGLAPTVSVSGSQSINVPAGSVSYTGQAPAAEVSDNQSISVPVGSVSYNGYTPSIGIATASPNINVPVGGVTYNGLVPTVTGVQAANVISFPVRAKTTVFQVRVKRLIYQRGQL